MTRRHFGEFEQILLYAVLHLEGGAEGASGPTIRRSLETHTGRTISPGAIYTALESTRGARAGRIRDGRADT